MEESVDLREESSRADDEIIDDDAVGHESTSAAAAAAADVISRCEPPDVWERISNNEDRQSDGDDVAGSTNEHGERERRWHQLITMLEILQGAEVNEMDDVLDLELSFRTRHEVMHLLETFDMRDVHAGVQVEERMTNLWRDVLAVQRRAADDRRLPEQCNICLELVQLDRRPCCRLPVCRDCMTTYVTTHLEQTGAVHIGCPSADCDAFVFHDEIRELLGATPRLRARYDRWLVDANADPRRKTCPRCSRVTELHDTTGGGPSRRRRSDKYGVMVDCPDCQLSWCFACQSPWHDGLTCARSRTGDELLKRWARQRVRDEHNAQRCPRCKVGIRLAESGFEFTVTGFRFDEQNPSDLRSESELDLM